MNTIPDATKSCKESLSQLVERLLAGNPPNGAKPEDYGDHEQVARDLIDAAPAGPETVRRVAGVWAEEDVYAFLLPPEEERDGGAWQPFPLDTLPDAVAGYARAASRAIPADPAFVAMPMLAVLSAAIGAKARIQLKRGWEEPPTIWTMLVAPSGSSKSPALQYALRPVYRLEAHERDVYEHKRTAYERAKEGGEKAEKPVRRRYRTGDATVESVVSVLSENPHGILLARDELAAWIGSFDRYANGAADLQAWIEMHGGLQVSTDRKTSGNVTIDRPAVAVTGTIQPGTLRDKIGEIHFDTGFAARLLMAQPPVQPKEWTEADVARETDEAYETLLQRLYEFEPLQLTLTQAAKEKWIRFVNDHGQRVYEMAGGVRKTITSKEEMHAARLALDYSAFPLGCWRG